MTLGAFPYQDAVEGANVLADDAYSEHPLPAHLAFLLQCLKQFAHSAPRLPAVR